MQPSRYLMLVLLYHRSSSILPKICLREETSSGSLTVDLQAPNGLRDHLSWEVGKGLLIFDKEK